MQQSFGQRPVTAPAVLGGVLIVVGIATLVVREAGVNLFGWIGAWGWPFFIIVPGVVLLALALFPTPPRGVGFATAGAVVTTVGSILLYQWRTGHWESWAYAWALIPLFVGVALVLYGLLVRERGMVGNGLWMAAIAALLFTAGAWFFEGIFAGEARPTDLAQWWPLGVVILGMALVIRALFLAPAQPLPPVGAPQQEAPITNEPEQV